jgi:hypothetical protein
MYLVYDVLAMAEEERRKELELQKAKDEKRREVVEAKYARGRPLKIEDA